MHLITSSLSLALIFELIAAATTPAIDDAVAGAREPATGATLVAAATSEETTGEETTGSGGSERRAPAEAEATSPESRAAGGDERPRPAARAEAEAEPTTDAGRVSDEARPLVEKVQAFYEGTDDFTADFHQTYIYLVGRQVESRGTVSFKKPAMMRWNYEHPRERTFIVDGTDLWIWTPEDLTVVRQRGFTASDLSTSITFLWGEGRLEDEFHIELEGEDTLSLTPIRPEGAFQKVLFKVDTDTGGVLESTVIDPQGNRNHMVFSDVKQNTGLGDDRFVFTVPAGADLQEMPELR